MIIVVIVEGVFEYINVSTQEDQLLNKMRISADRISNTITGGTWRAMLEDRREDAYQTMQIIGRQDSIDKIRIFSRDGRIMYSTAKGETGSWLDKKAEECYLCHIEDEPLVHVDVQSRSRIFQRPDGSGRILAMIKPIYNERACWEADCHAHPENVKILGVLDVSMPLDRVDEEVAGIRLRAFLVAIVAIVLISLFIAFFTRRFVSRPISRLIEGTKDVSVMDLDKPIDIETRDELGQLAKSFNEMRKRLKAAMEEINEFTHTLEVKVEERTEQLKVVQMKLIQSDRLASLGQLAASVAHEINNPIGGVLNLAMLMERILKDDGIPPDRVEDFRKYLSQITSETSRVGRIVSDLLSFSRRSRPERTGIDFNETVIKTVSLLAHKMELAGVKLDLELDGNLPDVSCDGSQMQQVIINLIMNATESMPDGGAIKVRTMLGKEKDTAVMEIEDAGVGIPEEQFSHIFDPFFTTKEKGKGIGLGLAVVYGIIDAHGGIVDVRSRIGKGTVFTVTLPIHTAKRRQNHPGNENGAGQEA